MFELILESKNFFKRLFWNFSGMILTYFRNNFLWIIFGIILKGFIALKTTLLKHSWKVFEVFQEKFHQIFVWKLFERIRIKYFRNGSKAFTNSLRAIAVQEYFVLFTAKFYYQNSWLKYKNICTSAVLKCQVDFLTHRDTVTRKFAMQFNFFHWLSNFILSWNFGFWLWKTFRHLMAKQRNAILSNQTSWKVSMKHSMKGFGENYLKYF